MLMLNSFTFLIIIYNFSDKDQKIKEGVAELPTKKLSKSLNFHKLRLFYVHKIL